MKDNAPVTQLSGVGPQTAQRLERLGIESVHDLLFHLPYRYQDRTRIQNIADLKSGEDAVVQGTVNSTEIKVSKRRMLICTIADDTGTLILRFFHFTPNQQQQLSPGTAIRCFGEARAGYYDALEMAHPDYQLLHDAEAPLTDATLTPVYPLTEGVHQKLLRNLTEQVLYHDMPDYLPAEIVQALQFPSLSEALQTLHRPPPEIDTAAILAGEHPAQQRLAFEELLAHHLSMRMLHQRAQVHQAPVFNSEPGTLAQKFLAQLPFKPTNAQQRVCNEISVDVSKPKPMQRLVQGDVGSGKTLVAALVALQALESGYQTTLMAPTELLAEQHLRTFSDWFEPFDIEVIWLAGSLTKKQRQQSLERIASNPVSIVIGTHALFQEGVEFTRLGLTIVDEQHRFGVHQRLTLRDKGSDGMQRPHQLIMTATPIPRTLAMTAYANLDVSVIDELPPGRTPVATVVIPDNRRTDIIQRVASACEEGRQAYWVCPLIEESEVLQCQAAEDTAEILSQSLPQLNIGLVHGRMKSAEKEAVMSSFSAGDLHLLVATTVIEVGVNVPNASLMLIENAERLGLSQLHQLRGRVGRGAVESHCVLIYQNPLSLTAKSRLSTMRETQDGFVIAERDLELRGPGEIMGEISLLDGGVRSADAVAASDIVSLIAIDRQTVLRVLKRSPDMVFAVISELCRRVRNASEMFEVKSEKQARV
ncbi:MAG: ATP-dependent DNA helicase RecG, partial [Pseudomonadota bacterium]